MIWNSMIQFILHNNIQSILFISRKVPLDSKNWPTFSRFWPRFFRQRWSKSIFLLIKTAILQSKSRTFYENYYYKNSFGRKFLSVEQIHRKIQFLKIFTDDVIAYLSDQKWSGSSNSVIRVLYKSVLCNFIMGRLSLNFCIFNRKSHYQEDQFLSAQLVLRFSKTF